MPVVAPLEPAAFSRIGNCAVLRFPRTKLIWIRSRRAGRENPGFSFDFHAASSCYLLTRVSSSPMSVCAFSNCYQTRFTARPRAVFHKHADVMILVAHLKIGDRVICSDTVRILFTLVTISHFVQLELVFRGGTGSIHGAENRGRASPVMPSTPHSCPPHYMYNSDAPQPVPLLPNAAPSPLSWCASHFRIFELRYGVPCGNL